MPRKSHNWKGSGISSSQCTHCRLRRRWAGSSFAYAMPKEPWVKLSRAPACLLPDEKEPVKVRIAVVVNEKGEWTAAGGDQISDAEKKQAALDMGEGSSAEGLHVVHWVEADVPIPMPAKGETIRVNKTDVTEDNDGEA